MTAEERATEFIIWVGNLMPRVSRPTMVKLLTRLLNKVKDETLLPDRQRIWDEFEKQFPESYGNLKAIIFNSGEREIAAEESLKEKLAIRKRSIKSERERMWNAVKNNPLIEAKPVIKAIIFQEGEKDVGTTK